MFGTTIIGFPIFRPVNIDPDPAWLMIRSLEAKTSSMSRMYGVVSIEMPVVWTFGLMTLAEPYCTTMFEYPSEPNALKKDGWSTASERSWNRVDPTVTSTVDDVVSR